jgi:hypothetical protein
MNDERGSGAVMTEEQSELSPAAVVAIRDAQLTPYLYAEGGVPVRWERAVRVDYVPAEGAWRPARAGEKCGAGAGARPPYTSKACGADAVVTLPSMRGEKPYRLSRCEVHSDGRLPLADGRVIEPVANPLGGA